MLTPGTVLRDSYLIMRQLGQGGMGAVYLARHQRLGSTVAVKETFFNDAALLKAFEHEARLLAGLRHPALPKVIDHFPEGGGHFLVMEFISGDDLVDILQKQGCAFPVSQVLEWGDQLLGALEYLHKQVPPVIHRDIKPQNLKLTEDGQLVLLDFGLAKGYAEGMSQVLSSKSIQAYTPDYAPLEQMQGIGTDPRSDLYSLAATMYHLMTGFTPVNALNRAAVVVTGLPDPLQPAHVIHPQVPPLVAEVITRAMLLNRDQRPATAAVMRVMLREAAGHQPGAGIVPVAPNAGATLIAASDTNPNNRTITNPISSPLAQPFAPQAPSVSHPAAPTAWATHQPEQTTAPRPALLVATPSLPQVERKGNRITWIAIGLAVLLFAGILPGPGPYPFALRLLMYPPFLVLLTIGVICFGYAMILRLQAIKSPEPNRKGNAVPWAALGLAVLLLILFIRLAPPFGFGFVSRALLASLWLVVLLMIGAAVAVFAISRKNSASP